MAFYQRFSKWFNFGAGATAHTPAQMNVGLSNPYGGFPRPVASVPLGNGGGFPRPAPSLPLGNGGLEGYNQPIGVRPSPSVPLGTGFSYQPGHESAISPVGHPLLPSPYRGGEQ